MCNGDQFSMPQVPTADKLSYLCLKNFHTGSCFELVNKQYLMQIAIVVYKIFHSKSMYIYNVSEGIEYS